MGISRSGVGLVVAQLYSQYTRNHQGEIVVLNAPYGGPGQRAGLRAGDAILSVDGVSTKGKRFVDVVEEQLRGECGSVANLRVQRAGETFDVRVRRTPLHGRDTGVTSTSRAVSSKKPGARSGSEKVARRKVVSKKQAKSPTKIRAGCGLPCINCGRGCVRTTKQNPHRCPNGHTWFID